MYHVHRESTQQAVQKGYEYTYKQGQAGGKFKEGNWAKWRSCGQIMEEGIQRGRDSTQ